ncbi:MAG: LysM peptidoglycan-binding domain-containing protein [Gemmatimonadaceae bacterium]
MGSLDARSGREEDKERSRPDFSNVRSDSSSTADSPVEQKPAAESTKSYTVVAGDTLSAIARHEYGDANEWRVIYEANKHLIKNPDIIYPGQELTIPQR